jgi:prepilin-type N-terminal cleavage/methylation domain-containing protein
MSTLFSPPRIAANRPIPPSPVVHPTHQPRSPGFTLVEILVVLGVLAVLVALIVPAVRGALERSNTTSDIGKLKQIGTAMAAFAADNDGRLPHAGIRLPPPVPSSESYVWAEAVDRYLDPLPNFWNRTSYNWVNRPNSPFFSQACDPYPGFNQPSTSYPLWKRPLAFSYNRFLDDDRWAGYINRIPNLSKTVIVGEINGLNTLPMSPMSQAEFRSNAQSRYRVSRPGNKALYLFADYHVETLEGDRGLAYFAANPNETNIWRWW